MPKIKSSLHFLCTDLLNRNFTHFGLGDLPEFPPCFPSRTLRNNLSRDLRIVRWGQIDCQLGKKKAKSRPTTPPWLIGMNTKYFIKISQWILHLEVRNYPANATITPPFPPAPFIIISLSSAIFSNICENECSTMLTREINGTLKPNNELKYCATP